jgi:nucleoid-associated protein YgaU
MGFFDFVKSAGAKLLGSDDEKAIDAAAAKEASADDDMDALREKLRLAQVGTNLKREVGKLGLEVKDLAISYDGEAVTAGGDVASDEIREKVVLAVGNWNGVSSVNDEITVSGAKPSEDNAGGATFYTVVRGDTLGGIAKKHYGNAGKYPVIFEANRPMLSDPDKIYPGQTLRIPPLD